MCHLEFHYGCAGITEGGYRKLGDRKLNWRCPKCKQPGLQSPQPCLTPTSPDIVLEIRALAVKLQALDPMAADLKVLRSEVSDLKDQISEANSSIRLFNGRVSALEERVTQVEKSQEQVELLHAEVINMKVEVNAREQWLRINNVEVKGIPQTSNENLYTIIQSIGSKVNYCLQKQLISFITRVPTREKSQPCPIIVSFANRYVKEDFLAACRAANKVKLLTSADLELRGNTNIYVNDHLTVQNKELLQKTKKVAKEKNFAYTWVKHAKIFLRKNDTSPIICIRSEVDLSKIH
ncbi:uncharacterized protein LOC132902887 [Amyelois transitella]|uniref:uncharacterized protein LOC132902887 n=1 Tax=Amyelois transitella TaxID=680683 RepID=UPI0029904251|nr:uncharacterized protein LOC132902887 [Amyelois transitella]